MMPVDPMFDPELRWVHMRVEEMNGQQRLPLPGIDPPSPAEYREALDKLGKRKGKK